MKKFPILFTTICMFCMHSCGFHNQPIPAYSNNTIQTFAAQTLELIPSSTLTVYGITQPANVETYLPAQATRSSSTPTSIISIAPSLTPFSNTDLPDWVNQTATPLASTLLPLPTPDFENKSPCNLIEFIQDVTIPDGMSLPSGLPFTKVWRLKNVGTCAWTTAYKIVHYSGEKMGGRTTSLTRTVFPGETIDLAINLIAPSENGNYKGNWMIEGPDGVFGSGANGSIPFYVQIITTPNSKNILYNFALNFCAAKWESNAGRLFCPGTVNDPMGIVILSHNPQLETRQENEPTLYMHPMQIEEGWITGSFPALDIQIGDRLFAEIGCLAEFTNCNVNFHVSYRIPNTPQRQLGVWQEYNDQHTTKIDIDLSFLAGKSVVFILGVRANQAPDQAGAFWLMPQIRRP